MGGIGGSKGAPGTRPPRESKFFHFHAVFSKNSINNSSFGSWRTPLGKILDPPLGGQEQCSEKIADVQVK